MRLISAMSVAAIALQLSLSACGGETTSPRRVVEPPPTDCTRSGPWPCLPADTALKLVRETSWDALSGGGWNFMKTEGDGRIIADNTAPTGGTDRVLELVYPAGFAGGTAPAQLWTGLGNSTSRPQEMFVGMWWKMGAPGWQGHSSGVNKIQYLFSASDRNVIMTAYGPRNGPWRIIGSSYLGGPIRMLEPNAGQVPIVANTWYRLEWYLRYPSTPGGADGILRWWVDGTLVGNYTDVAYPADAGFVEYKLGSVWGGVNDAKVAEEYMRFDHISLFAR